MFQEQYRKLCSAVARPAIAGFATLTLAITIALSPAASAQTFQVIHNFTGGGDGGSPPYTLVKDSAGHFVGTANSGGQNGYGSVFRLVKVNNNWIVKPIYSFTGQDGQPGYGLTLGTDGSVYTNASYEEVMGGPCGSALHLTPLTTPPRSIVYSWNETLMRTYVKREDGCPTGNLVLDSAGNVYGVTQIGGANSWGSVFELSPSESGWTETVLYSFRGQEDGGAPYAGMIIDNAGNLYGTTSASQTGFGFGTVFELSPSGSGWTYKTLYTFQGGTDGGQPVAGVIFDNAGNLYGATTSFGSGGGGTAFKLTPSGGSWNFTLLSSFTGADGPVASLTMDSAGKLYGTTFMDDSFGYGSVFKLTPSGGTWTYTDLHDFTGGSDGGYPGGGVVLDASGNVYGTAVIGGSNGFGVVYEIASGSR